MPDRSCTICCMEIVTAVELLGQRQQGLVTSAQLAGVMSRSRICRGLRRGDLV